LREGVSYFCRMAMASTDSIFVGHYEGGHHTPGDYLAASALSDMVTTLLVVPPLAFNQVLNALCGQAVGSGKKKMAGVWLQQSLFWLGISMLPFLAGFFYVKDILHLLGFSDTICELAAGLLHHSRVSLDWLHGPCRLSSTEPCFDLQNSVT
jgi:MATE family multidrug resistance protein